MRTIISAAFAIIIHLIFFYWIFNPKKSTDQSLTSTNLSKYSTIDLTPFNSHTLKPKITTPSTLGAKPSNSTSEAASGSSSGKSESSISSGDLPFFEYFIEPEYPKLARMKGIEGKVKVKVTFDNLGKPAQILILQSSQEPILDESVKKAASKWKAAKINSIFEKTFEFKLKN